jgi:uncharacterized protein (AIM24 family)
MQWSLLAAVALLHATHASEPALRVDAASGVVRARLRQGESMTANSACVVGCSGRTSSGRLLRSTPLVALGRKKRWWQRGLLRKKDSPFAAYSTRADEAVIMVSSSRVGHAACVVDASNSTVVLAERSVLCATPGTELEASAKSGLVTVKRGAVAVQGPGRVVAHVVPKDGRLDAKAQRVVAWTLQSEAAHDAKDWRAFAGPAVVYLASAAPPAPLGRLLRMRASPSKGGLKSAAKGVLRKAALSLVAALLLLLGSLVARPEKSIGDLPGEVLALYRGGRRAAAAITAGATAASRAAGAARRELQGDPSNETT